jgi:hypothetical protein
VAGGEDQYQLIINEGGAVNLGTGGWGTYYAEVEGPPRGCG